MFWLFVAGTVIFVVILTIYRKIISPSKKAINHMLFAENMLLSILEKDAPEYMAYFMSSIKPQFERIGLEILRSRTSFRLEQDPYYAVLLLNELMQSKVDGVQQPDKSNLIVAICMLRVCCFLESHSKFSDLSGGKEKIRNLMEKYPELQKDFSFYLDNVELHMSNLPF